MHGQTEFVSATLNTRINKMKNSMQPRYNKSPIFICTLVLIPMFFFLLYFNAWYGAFTRDDIRVIVQNAFLREWKYFPKIFTRDYFLISGETNYRPIVTISYFIDYAICRLNPIGFHMTNVIFHTINSVLFYLLLRLIIRNKQVVILSVLFFVTHPVLLESVNVAAYRSDILCALFLLISLVYFIKADSMENNHKTRFALYYPVSLIAYICALFSKEMAITLPALLPLFVIFSGQNIRQGIGRRLKRIYIGYLVIAALYLVFRFLIMRSVEIKTAYLPGGFWPNVFTMVKILASYVKLSFLPYNLHPGSMVHVTNTPLDVTFILSVMFLISIFIIFTYLCKSRNMFGCWMAWFFITLLPVMNIIPLNTIMADRYLYIPVIGFCAAKGILIYRITDPTLSTRSLKLRKVVQFTLVIIMTVSYGFSLVRKNERWMGKKAREEKTIHIPPGGLTM